MNILTWTILKNTQIFNGCETFAYKYIKKKISLDPDQVYFGLDLGQKYLQRLSENHTNRQRVN